MPDIPQPIQRLSGRPPLNVRPSRDHSDGVKHSMIEYGQKKGRPNFLARSKHQFLCHRNSHDQSCTAVERESRHCARDAHQHCERQRLYLIKHGGGVLKVFRRRHPKRPGHNADDHVVSRTPPIVSFFARNPMRSFIVSSTHPARTNAINSANTTTFKAPISWAAVAVSSSGFWLGWRLWTFSRSLLRTVIFPNSCRTISTKRLRTKPGMAP